MSETTIHSELGFNLGEELSEQYSTPPIQLAYEGLMRLVEMGRMSHEDALGHLHTMFPNH